jgi:RNA polymerase subunit RPABC4/transcription elongation factor Spt4
MTNKEKKYHYWYDLYIDAKSKRKDLDDKIIRRNKLYKGTGEVRNLKTGEISSKKAICLRNMCFELIETQINNSVPSPKVTPRDDEDTDLALELEGYLKSEMDRLDSEVINDKSEREVYKQGTGFYMVGWNSEENTPISRGELTVKFMPLSCVYPQPGIKNIEDAEYIFVEELVSLKKIKRMYGVDAPESGNYRGMNVLVTAYYLNDDGYLSRFGWIEDCVVFDEDYYELRQFRRCKKCGEDVPEEKICPVCGSKSFEWVAEEDETLIEDIVSYDINDPKNSYIMAKAGTKVPYYKIKQLPFVMRVNISDTEGLYGISDIDILENNQESLNKVLTKIQENVLKGGAIVTVPTNVNVPNTDDTLKIVKIKDPNQAKAFSVNTFQANIQQDDIFQDRSYNFARSSLGITDSYQGKRDPTAESGKAKEISAAQASGRLESKRRMKDAAYADLYQLMFKFLLAYCDEPRTYTKISPTGDVIKGKFSRYNYLKEKDNGDIYYNDRFLFSADNASALSTNREAMWRETVNNFQSGTFGNPADPQTLLLFWNTMKGLGYPLAEEALLSLRERMQQLPYELQQAIMQNPEILQELQTLLQQKGGSEDVSNSKQ